LADLDLIEYRPPFHGSQIQVLKYQEGASLDLNFSELRKKMSAAYDKLDLIENYIYTDGCRQAYILEYFGEPGRACGKCDICLQSSSAPIKTKEYFGEEEAKSEISTKLTQLSTYDSFLKTKSLERTAEQRQLSVEEVINHLAFALKAGLPVDISKLVSKEDKQVIMFSQLLW
jgi:ATP-dependent DNA helicase RecQ